MDKICNICKAPKPLEAFHQQKGGKYGKRGKCKACIAQEYAENRPARRAAAKVYYQSNRGVRLEYHRDRKARRVAP